MNTLDLIRDEMSHAHAGPQMIGGLLVKSGNDWVDEAMSLPDPTLHFHGMIAEHELTVLFAAAGVGKSILAVQIADEIAQTKDVLYIDLELTEKQFQKRYTIEGRRHMFPSRFTRAVLNEDDPGAIDIETCVIDSIRAAVENNIPVVILDNLSYACRRSESAEEATLLMQQLRHYVRQFGLTLIVIAHSPKRYYSSPITRNDLAGSHKLMVAFDAAVAIGEVSEDKRQRYVKQVKVRSAEMVYDTESVMLCELSTDEGWLHFIPLKTMSEYSLIKAVDPKVGEVLRLHDEGKSVREIAAITGTPRSTVDRWIKTNQASVPDVPTVPSVPPMGQSGQMGQLDSDDIDDLLL